MNDTANPITEHLINFTLQLADNALILSQTQSKWCGHGPVLEQDIAITNITLDILGQARNFYQYAALLKNDDSTEDSLAYLRTEREFKNCLLVEQPNGDWAQSILKIYFYSQFHLLFFEQLKNSEDKQLAAIAEKSIKEVIYHVKWSQEWVIRLGDGTFESNGRMQKAIAELWAYTGEMFLPIAYETELIKINIAPDVSLLKNEWLQKVTAVFEEATLSIPQNIYMHTGGKNGVHTEMLGYILSDLQYLQRTYPNASW